MTKGTYRVNDDENPNKTQPKDTSFKSCICALLFVLVICIIILIATSIYSPRSKKDKQLNGELLELGQEKSTENTTAKIIKQTEATTTENYNKNFSHGVLQTTTTENNQYTLPTNATTTQYFTESSSVAVTIKNENSSMSSDYSTTLETQTENASTGAYSDTESSISISLKYQYSTFNADNDSTSETPTDIEETTTKEIESISTDNPTTFANYDTESSVSVSSKYQYSTFNADIDTTSETPTEYIEETTKENESISTDNHSTSENYDTESTISISPKYQYSTFNADNDSTSETPTDIEETTTKEIESISTDNPTTFANYDTESSVSVSSKYQYSTFNADIDTTSETPTEYIEETTKENESISTDNHSTSENYDTESTISISPKYQYSTFNADNDSTSETPTDIEETTTKEIESISTDNPTTFANYDTESSVSVSSKYQYSTFNADIDTTSETPTEYIEETTKENESISTDNHSTSENYDTESTISISPKYQYSTFNADNDSTSETPTDIEETTTKEIESISTDNPTTFANYDTESSVSVSSKYQYSTFNADIDTTSETPTEYIEETTKENESISTDNHSTSENYDTESTISISPKYQYSTFNADNDSTSETPTDIEETTTKEIESISTDNPTTFANYDTESSVSVSSKYQYSTFNADIDTTSETPTEYIEETTKENESISTDNHSTSENYDTESTVSVSSKYQYYTFNTDNDTTSEAPTTSIENITTKENESISTDNHSTSANYDTESTVSVSSQYQYSTFTSEAPTTSIEKIITKENESISTDNHSTTDTSLTDASTNSIDMESTALTTSKDEKLTDNTEFLIPNDSSGGFDFYNEPDPSTTQTSVRQPLNQQVVNTPDICPTAECKTVASRVLSLMNHSEDPCEDFYEFACGETRVHNNNRDTWDRLSKEINLINDTALPHFKALKSFYTSCVDHEKIFNYTDRILQVTKLVKEVGWIIDSKADSSSVNLTSLFAELILRQSLPIFDVEVDLDSQTKTFILKLLPRQIHSMFAESGRWSGLSESQIRCLIVGRDALQSPKLDLNKIYLSYLDCRKNQETYLNSVETVVENLGLYSDAINWYNKSQLIKELRTSIEWKFLTFLEELPTPNIVPEKILFKKPDQNYAVMTVENLQDKYPLVNWKIMFEIITGNVIPNETQIETYFPDYLEKIFQDLQNDKSSSSVEINNALISMYAHSLYQNLVIPQARHHREDYCLKLSTKLFQDVSNNLYVKSWKNTDFVDYRKSSLEIFSQLKNKLKTEVETQSKWLDESSKQSLLTKLETIKLIVTEENDRYNYGGYLQQKYQIEFEENNWPSKAVKMMTTYRKMLYSIQGSDFSTEKLWSFFVNAHDSTPTSLYGLGWTVTPLGTIKKYTKNVPNYVTMIKIGLPLAREIGHHFDHEGIVNGMNLFGRSRDYYNYMNNLMNNNTLNATMLVGNQEVSFDVAPQLSANERIADNTALRLLSEIYNENPNPDLPWISTSYPKQKLFFIMVAQEYCSRISMPEFMQKLFESEILPSTLRVKNIVTNSEEFSKAFECSSTAKKSDGVSNKIQFPYLENLDIEKYYNSLQ